MQKRWVYGGSVAAAAAGGEGGINAVDRREGLAFARERYIHHTAPTRAPRARWPDLKASPLPPAPSLNIGVGIYCLRGRLGILFFDSSVAWWLDRSGWLVGRLAGRLVGWSAGRLAGWPAG